MLSKMNVEADISIRYNDAVVYSNKGTLYEYENGVIEKKAWYALPITRLIKTQDGYLYVVGNTVFDRGGNRVHCRNSKIVDLRDDLVLHEDGSQFSIENERSAKIEN